MNTFGKMRYFYRFLNITIDKKRRFLYYNIINNSIVLYGNIMDYAALAQLVEQQTENLRVWSSILRGGKDCSTCSLFI